MDLHPTLNTPSRMNKHYKKKLTGPPIKCHNNYIGNSKIQRKRVEPSNQNVKPNGQKQHSRIKTEKKEPLIISKKVYFPV